MIFNTIFEYNNFFYKFIQTETDITVTICGYTIQVPPVLIFPDTIGGYPVTIINSYKTTPANLYGFTNNSCSSITFPKSLVEIAEFAFLGNDTLQTLIFPDSLMIIREFAFTNNYKLKKIILSKNLKTIDTNAFRWAESLKYIVIPDSVTFIGAGAFSNCFSLLTVLSKEDNENFRIS